MGGGGTSGAAGGPGGDADANTGGGGSGGNGTAGGDGADQDFIVNIGSETVSDEPLAYTLEVIDCGALFATLETLTVEYTNGPQP